MNQKFALRKHPGQRCRGRISKRWFGVPAPFLLGALTLMLAGCAAVPLSERALGYQLPTARNATGADVAQITFSADQKYETPKGVPLEGDPVICAPEGIFRVNDGTTRTDQVTVKAGDEIAVSSVIQWLNTGWRKTCWPFVAFTPESSAKYVVVNERIGGKGASALWTGVAFQTCAVSVYKETATGFQRVIIRKPSFEACRPNAQ